MLAVQPGTHVNGMVIREWLCQTVRDVDVQRLEAAAGCVAKEDPVEALGAVAPAAAANEGIVRTVGRMGATREVGGVDETGIGDSLRAAAVFGLTFEEVEVAHDDGRTVVDSKTFEKLVDLVGANIGVAATRLQMGHVDAELDAGAGLDGGREHSLPLEAIDAAPMSVVLDVDLGLSLEAAYQGEAGVTQALRKMEMVERQRIAPRPPELLDPDDVVGGLEQVTEEALLALPATVCGRPGQAPQVHG